MILRRIRAIRERARSDRGAVAILTAILVPVFLLLTATAVDIGNWYVEAQKAQTAADAAATAGVTYLPQDSANAFVQAKATALANGYPNASVVTSIAGRPSQLLVTVSGTVTNIFGSIFGNPTTTISRSAVADFTAPAIMGSPCNAIGNRPPSSPNGAQPVGSVVPSSASGGYLACDAAPGFWLNMAGPATDKVRGDQFATRTNCSVAASEGCAGGTNTEHKPDGYFYVVRVTQAVVDQGVPVTVQAYDPAFVQVGDTCTAGPTGTTYSVNVTRKALAANVVTLTTAVSHGLAVGAQVTISNLGSPYNGTYSVKAVPTPTTFTYDRVGANQSDTADPGTMVTAATMINPYSFDAAGVATRYARDTTAAGTTGDDARTYCPGDAIQNDNDYLNTSFVMRQQTDTYDPTKAPPVAGCSAVQFAGLQNSTGTNLVPPTAEQLTAGAPGYNPGLARVFRQWVDLCTFTPTRAGDYYLQIRTNVPLVGTNMDGTTYTALPDAITDPAAIEQGGVGHNRFAIRAKVDGVVASGPNAGKPLATQVAVSGWERMSIYANAQSVTANFNLIQVLPNAAGSSFAFTTWDNGDANCTPTAAAPLGCTVQVLLPVDAVSSDATPLVMGQCTGVGPVTGTLTNCTAVVSGNQGRLQTITVQVPVNYTCNPNSTGGCWYQVKVVYPSGVTDTTTWGALLGGDPVRLIR